MLTAYLKRACVILTLRIVSNFDSGEDSHCQLHELDCDYAQVTIGYMQLQIGNSTGIPANQLSVMQLVAHDTFCIMPTMHKCFDGIMAVCQSLCTTTMCCKRDMASLSKQQHA